MSKNDEVQEQYIEGKFLDLETLRRFATPNTWSWFAAAMCEWVIIGLTMWLCRTWLPWWLWPLGIFLIGTRQHALGIMAHEGTHYLVSRNRFWNDLLPNLLAAYPLTYTVEAYRANHLRHHRWLDTPQDPERASVDLYPDEWRYPMPKTRFYWLLLRDSLGLYLKQTLPLLEYVWAIPGGNLPHIIRVAVYHAAWIAVAILTGQLLTYLVLWIVPLYTVAIMCFRFRTAAEHSAIAPDEQRYTRKRVDTVLTTRTTMGRIAGFVFAPYNMSYHIEHHLYPSVPVFRLRALHQLLMQNPSYAANAHVATSYHAMVSELTT
ncbi:fatty acid desaturase family protein [Candidatus Entotheonella palauensis]|uniref:fatty acid desaturase family protein n=1 Tax=Candidatus Entotheonella palauensis TaxID=93172 RepID=UPI000B7F54AD|nr:fatty acid desaturase family protein [Candidatus Entotheonella palauensis]